MDYFNNDTNLNLMRDIIGNFDIKQNWMHYFNNEIISANSSFTEFNVVLDKHVFFNSNNIISSSDYYSRVTTIDLNNWDYKFEGNNLILTKR